MKYVLLVAVVIVGTFAICEVTKGMPRDWPSKICKAIVGGSAAR